MAREVIKAEDIVDYTQKENIAEKFARRFGAGAASALLELALRHAPHLRSASSRNTAGRLPMPARCLAPLRDGTASAIASVGKRQVGSDAQPASPPRSSASSASSSASLRYGVSMKICVSRSRARAASSSLDALAARLALSRGR